MQIASEEGEESAQVTVGEWAHWIRGSWLGGGRARTRSHKSHRPTVQLVLGSSVWVTGRCLGTASHYRSQGEVCEVPGRDTPLRFCFHQMLRLEV